MSQERIALLERYLDDHRVDESAGEWPILHPDLDDRENTALMFAVEPDNKDDYYTVAEVVVEVAAMPPWLQDWLVTTLSRAGVSIGRFQHDEVAA